MNIQIDIAQGLYLVEKGIKTEIRDRPFPGPAQFHTVIEYEGGNAWKTLVPLQYLLEGWGDANFEHQCYVTEKMQVWYGEPKKDWQDFALVLNEARRGNPAVSHELEAAIANKSNPAIIRATLLTELPRYLSATSLPLIQDTLKDKDPMVRLSGISGGNAGP